MKKQCHIRRSSVHTEICTYRHLHFNLTDILWAYLLSMPAVHTATHTYSCALLMHISYAQQKVLRCIQTGDQI